MWDDKIQLFLACLRAHHHHHQHHPRRPSSFQGNRIFCCQCCRVRVGWISRGIIASLGHGPAPARLDVIHDVINVGHLIASWSPSFIHLRLGLFLVLVCESIFFASKYTRGRTGPSNEKDFQVDGIRSDGNDTVDMIYWSTHSSFFFLTYSCSTARHPLLFPWSVSGGFLSGWAIYLLLS